MILFSTEIQYTTENKMRQEERGIQIATRQLFLLEEKIYAMRMVFRLSREYPPENKKTLQNGRDGSKNGIF